MARIVVVEDDPLVREMIVDALSERDHELVAYPDFASAYAGLVAVEPDLLVCDLDLPDGAGLDLITKIRRLHPNLPVLIQSGRVAEDELLAGFAVGADDYLTKPISIHELQAKCSVILARAAKQAPSISGGHELPGGMQKAFGRYRLMGILGTGGFGTVYDADDLEADVPVALKVLPSLAGLDDSVRQRFVREAYTLSLLDHPNLAKVYDFGSQEGRSYYAMERIEGPTLDSYVEDRGPLTEPELIALLQVLVHVLSAVHAQGLVHRDQKPANVVLRGESPGDPVLIDFGLAKQPGDRTVTKSGEVLGSPHYLSPEQILSKPVSARSDQFALGLVARFAATGSDLWAERELLDLLRALATQPVPMPSSLTEPLRQLLRRLTRIDPAQRFPSLAEVSAQLEALSDG